MLVETADYIRKVRDDLETAIKKLVNDPDREYYRFINIRFLAEAYESVRTICDDGF